MENLIEKVSKKLKDHPNIEYLIDSDNNLIIKPSDKNGFEVCIQQSDRENTIHFNSWHFHFDNSPEGNEELIQYLGFGLSKYGRIKTYSRNGKEYKWTFETLSQNGNKWLSAGTTGLINLNFWNKKEIKYYQNNLINPKITSG